MNFRPAMLEDCPLLGALNHQLIHDEGHRNPMKIPQLEQRMEGWFAGEYRAVIYEDAGEVVAYALFKEQADEINLRQLFVVHHKRRQGIGRRALEILRAEVWPRGKRLPVEVLVSNEKASLFGERWAIGTMR